MHVCYGTLNRVGTFHWPPVHGLLRMDYRNGLPEWTSHQSLVVLIDNSKDSINERSGLQLTSWRSQKFTHQTKMQTIINIQILTRLRLLRKAKFLFATQSICHHKGRMNVPVEQLIRSIKRGKKMAMTAVHRSKQPSFGYVFLLFFFSR